MFTDKLSHVYTHNKLEDHEIDVNNAEILHSADNDNKLCWKEMLHIRQHNPTRLILEIFNSKAPKQEIYRNILKQPKK